jgi:cold shock protein
MANQDYPGAGDGAVVNAKVKWFRTDKGYGFVTPEDGTGDVFLHISVLKQLNLQDVPQGATIVCEVAQGQKGRQVVRVVQLDTSTAEAVPPPRRPREPQFERTFQSRSGPPRQRWGNGPSRGGPRGDGDF